MPKEIRALFLDIGGVLLTNGWGRVSQQLAVEKFGLDKDEMSDRHHIAFDAYEIDKMTLDEYLQLVIFYKERSFSPEDFKQFMFQQSKELPGHISFFKELKEQYKLKVFAVSNEGRDLNEYRIQQFGLDELFDAYISSAYVQLHKPDKKILQMACDVAHVPAEHALYVDDREVLIEVARSFGLQTLHFTGLETAREFLTTCTFYQPGKTK